MFKKCIPEIVGIFISSLKKHVLKTLIAKDEAVTQEQGSTLNKSMKILLKFVRTWCKAIQSFTQYFSNSIIIFHSPTLNLDI